MIGARGAGGVVIGVGDIVEYAPWHAPGPVRGTVSHVLGDGTVHLKISHLNRKGRVVESEVSFEPDQVHRLRVIREVNAAREVTS